MPRLLLQPEGDIELGMPRRGGFTDLMSDTEQCRVRNHDVIEEQGQTGDDGRFRAAYTTLR